MATNVIGRRVLQRGEKWLLHVPVFKTVYAPVKQLVAAFSPDNEAGFKKVVIVDDARRGMVLGFLTQEFTLDRGAGPEPWWRSTCRPITCISATSSCIRAAQAIFPDLSVEEGIRIFLTGGMALPTADARATGRQ